MKAVSVQVVQTFSDDSMLAHFMSAGEQPPAVSSWNRFTYNVAFAPVPTVGGHGDPVTGGLWFHCEPKKMGVAGGAMEGDRFTTMAEQNGLPARSAPSCPNPS